MSVNHDRPTEEMQDILTSNTNGLSSETEDRAKDVDEGPLHVDVRLKVVEKEVESRDGVKNTDVEEKVLLDNSLALEIENDSQLTKLRYGVLSSPPILITVMAALQHILLSISSCLTQSQVVADSACVPYDHPVRSQLFCTTMFMVGICTALQSAIGLRLPVFQGPSSSFLVPLLALQKEPTWKCPSLEDDASTALFSELVANGTADILNVTTTATVESVSDLMPEILQRLQMLSGSLMIAALVEVVLGGLGLLKLVVRVIGPITVACTVSLIAVSLYKLPILYGRPSLLMTSGTTVLVLIFVLYCKDITVPLPRCGKGSKNKPRKRFPIFQLIPILLALLVMWALAWLLTLTHVFTDDKDDTSYLARADAKLSVIDKSQWLQLTYPGQFGAPRISAAVIVGFVVAFFTSMIESVGDYFAAQKACLVARPPDNAISRGILIEGLGSVLSGAVGAGHATTSYSANIALLSVSKTASRHVMYAAAALLVGISLFGKAGAALTTVPNPILGGVIAVLIGTIFSIGVENLKKVDMTSSRNMVVVGLPFMCGIMIPACLEMYPDAVETGAPAFDQVLKVALSMPMFLGGGLALLLDNTVPGSLESRGMAPEPDKYESEKDTDEADQVEGLSDSQADSNIYTWSIYPALARVCPSLTRLPFMPKA